MTVLILKLARVPQLPAFGRFLQACDTFFQSLADAKALALKAQRRYPFTIE